MCASLCVNFGEYESCGVVLSSVGFDSSAQEQNSKLTPVIYMTGADLAFCVNDNLGILKNRLTSKPGLQAFHGVRFSHIGAV